MVARLRRFNQARHDASGITRVGRWLRATSFREWPQLFNVKRDRLIVGPRRHDCRLDATFDDMPGDGNRYLMTPGSTGLAQIKGVRGPITDASIAERLWYDFEYMRTCSFKSDLLIVFKTARSLVRPLRVHR